MLPAGPLNTTLSREMLSSRQPFSAWPSDSARELAPVTAKIARRTSGPITTPVSLTPRNSESASLSEDAVSGRRCVGLNSGSASFRISGAAGKRAAAKGRWLLMEPKSIGTSPAQTTHPTTIKAGKRIIISTRSAYARAGISSMHRRRRDPKRRTQLAPKILPNLGASVNLTPATGGDRHGRRSGGKNS